MHAGTLLRAGTIAFAGLTLLACATPTVPAGDVSGAGTVRYVALEGGFYAIILSDDRHFDPINLPPEFQRDGATVRISGVVRTDLLSTHMYGPLLELREITGR